MTTLATFNANNLFLRYQFARSVAITGEARFLLWV